MLTVQQLTETENIINDAKKVIILNAIDIALKEYDRESFFYLSGLLKNIQRYER
ncbi:hypothetical protein EYB33_12065 [Lysinibacillus sphaericus]|uniref:hypothetical protein n=1 Tax=Lysinibacillus TaxID=400634 RepID=UPI00159F24BC|nr:hypothetical protein [Lysinibacillus sphaericus]UDK96995.1 hypothetical protein EYB33_12065 [Lysinibacillus sphaericus]